MKMKKLLLLSPIFLPIPAQAITWGEFWEPFKTERVYIYERPMCNRRVYREQYIPGDRWNPGYVRSWYEWVRVPCYSNY
jgi:hypothetical protein